MLCFLLALLLSAAAAESPISQDAAPKAYHVAPTGKDDNDGSLESPFATIQKAADLAGPGDTVHIRGGTYREVVTVPRSGAPERPITFTAYQDEMVVLSGADPVTRWRRHEGDVWKARVDWDAGPDGAGNTLFVDGALKFDARQWAEDDPLRLENWAEIPRGCLTSTGITVEELKGFGQNYWKGAKVRHHTKDWVILTSTVADHDATTGKITFADPVGVISQKHVLGFYLFDTLKALDRPGEWFKDRQEKTLYYQAEPGRDPNGLEIEFKRRAYAFDVSGRDHLRIHRLSFRGAGIRTDGDAGHNTYERNRFHAFDKAGFGRFSLSGEGNVFRDNEVSHTWGGALSVGGQRNQLVNNWFHDIGFGGTARVLSISGSEHLVSHNTVRKFARSFVDGFPDRTEFCHNLFEDGANLSWDTGVFDGDSGRGNGGGCTVHHNVFRNTRAIGIYCAFYAGLDLVVHHNLVHDFGPSTLRAGQQSFLKYYHNTWIGAAPKGNVNAAGFAVESNYNNNLQVTTDNVASIGVDNRGNHNYQPADFVDFAGRDFRLAAGSGAIDAGVVLPGVNDGFRGAAPDAGALEFGESMWKFGHDFADPPDPVYGWESLPGTNIFGNGQFARRPEGWVYTGTPVWHDGNAWNNRSSGLSRIGGRVLQLQPGDGIRRTFTELKPDTWYTVGSEARLVDERIEIESFDGSSGTVHPARHRGEDYVDGLESGEWLRFDEIDFGRSGKYDQLQLIYTFPPGDRPRNQARVVPASLEVRLGRPDGQLLGEFRYNPAVVDSWDGTRIDIPVVAGLQSVYLVPGGPGAGVVRLANVRFVNTNIAPDDQLTLGVRGFGGAPVTTRVGEAYWRFNYEELTFKTGAAATSAEVFIQNGGAYDAYLDRLALFQKENRAELAQSLALSFEQLPGGIQFHLGGAKDLYEIRVTGASNPPGQLGKFRVSAWDTNFGEGGGPLWQRDYLERGVLEPGEVLVIKATDRSVDGVTELRDTAPRCICVQLLGSDNPGTANLEILTFDDIDLVVSDGAVQRGPGSWQVTFAQVINIGELILEKREDADRHELGELRIAVWDRSPTEGGKIVWEKDFHPGGSDGGRFVVPGDEVGSDGVTRLASVLGRAIRIEGLGVNQAGARIHGAESAFPIDNVALAGEATQSSDLYAGAGQAAVAINGLVLPKGDFTSTRPERRAWWQVELKETPTIDQIVIFNRVDAANRLGNFRVSVWNGDPEDGGSELWGKDYSYSRGDIPAGGSLTIHGDVTASGKRLDELRGGGFVRVQLHGSNILSLGEVQVWRK